MTLFEDGEFIVCRICLGSGRYWDEDQGWRNCPNATGPGHRDAPDAPVLTPAPVFDAQRASELGDEGMKRALRAERVQEWRQSADAWLDQLLPGTVFTADDLVKGVGLPDLPSEGQDRNNVIGGWTSGKAKSGQIIWRGSLQKSERPERHGNLQRVWRKV